jgi:DNA-binding NtrC family response regulator
MHTALYRRNREARNRLNSGDAFPVTQKRVLLLEQDAEVVEPTLELLNSRGFQVTRLARSAEALRALLTNEYDVVIFDMVMPNFSFDVFFLTLQRTRPYLFARFVFMRGYQTPPKVEAFIRRVEGQTLWKPFAPHELFEAVKVVLEQAQLSASTRASSLVPA